MIRLLPVTRTPQRKLDAACLLLLVACTTGGHTVPSHSSAAPSPSSSPSVLAVPSAPPAGDIPGRIVYEAAGGLWVMNADGTHRRQVTHSGPDVQFDPSWSPDGRRIVFRISSESDAVPDPTGIGLDSLGVADVASGHVTRIQPPQGGLFPDWSPLGNLILLSTVDGGLHAFDGGRHPADTVHTLRPDGSDLITLTHHLGECGEWSPDGTRILFCSHRGDGDFETWVMDANGSHARQLTSSPGTNDGAIWSPDGRQIVFSSTRSGDNELWMMDADGSHQHALLRLPDTGEAADSWLPQGIVFASFLPSAPLPSWFIVRPDGTGLRSLPQLRGAADPLDWIQP